MEWKYPSFVTPPTANGPINLRGETLANSEMTKAYNLQRSKSARGRLNFRGSASSDEGRYVSMEEYQGLKKQLADSEDRSQQLQRLNDTLAQEVNLLRSMVQKLMQENASLRAQVSQAESRKEELEHFVHLQSSMNDKHTDADFDHVPIDNISPHQTSRNPSKFFNSEPERSVPRFHSTPSTNESKSEDIKSKNPYDNINPTEPIIKTSTPIVVSVSSRKKFFEDETLRMSVEPVNGNQQSPQEYPVSSEDSAAFVTDDETPDVQSPEDSVPTQEDIVRATEQITKKIQELLLQAQQGRHSRYIPCSSNISTAVNDMANLFPKHPRQENVRGALRLMITSAARLQVECRSSVLPDRTIDAAMLTQQVIQCAYDIAKAAKQLVTTYNQA